MSAIDQVKILELMASKICHDLISPVGAISNGVEILEEMGGDDSGDIASLISFSASQANAKLKTMRMAYGLGGGDDSIKAEDVYKVFAEFIEGEKRISQDWDPHADLGIEPRTGFAKILICALLLAIEALPRGGIIRVCKDEDDGGMLVTGEGENAGFKDGYNQAINGTLNLDDPDPKLVHPYVTGLLLNQYSFTMSIDEAENNFIRLRLK